MRRESLGLPRLLLLLLLLLRLLLLEKVFLRCLGRQPSHARRVLLDLASTTGTLTIKTRGPKTVEEEEEGKKKKKVQKNKVMKNTELKKKTITRLIRSLSRAL